MSTNEWATLKFDGNTNQEPDKAPRIVVVEGRDRGRSVLVERAHFKIGRKPDNDFVLESGAVSRYHAYIIREEGFYYLEDNNSHNGVFVNDRQIEPS